VSNIWKTAAKFGLRKKEKIEKTRELILKLKILTVLPNHMKKLLWKLILDNYKEQDLVYLINYFYDNYLNDESYSAMINYDVTSEDQIVLMRTNNSCEGYHNRLRNIIKFSHSSPAYVITKLISEEDEFRKLTIGIVSRKKNCLKKVFGYINKNPSL